MDLGSKYPVNTRVCVNDSLNKLTLRAVLDWPRGFADDSLLTYIELVVHTLL